MLEKKHIPELMEFAYKSSVSTDPSDTQSNKTRESFDELNLMVM